MADKVIALHGGPVASDRAAHPDVVAHLEDLLERARSGEVIGVATVYMYRDSSIGYTACGSTIKSMMIGGLMALSTAYANDILEGR